MGFNKLFKRNYDKSHYHNFFFFFFIIHNNKFRLL
nr:MAG TPA: hypothetical protein [Caudoviricetes sp.]